MATTSRANAVPLNVIGVGLGRTGTASLRDALSVLGFGPCYHMSVIMTEKGKDLPTWFKIGDGNGTPEDFDELFHGYGSVVDAPAAFYVAEMYAAYPDAKFILTTRDPVKWKKSIKDTILLAPELLLSKPIRTKYEDNIIHWHKKYLQEKFHGGRLQEHAQQEILDHTDRVKHIIPSERLLVYEIGEGWDKLVEFLGVPKPIDAFPHVNDTAEFQNRIQRTLEGDTVW